MVTTQEIKQYAKESGFISCGITSADDFPEYSTALDRLISIFPETASLYRPMDKRAWVKKNTPWAKSIIVCIRGYGKYKIPEGIKGYIGRNYLFDSRVPQNPDFLMIKNFTTWLKNTGLRVKKGRLPDRLSATRAGVANIGKNNFAYTKTAGSWINIATYMVDAQLETDKPLLSSACPEGCDLCIRACPTGALSRPYLMRMDRCVAFLTYGTPVSVSDELSRKMGPWIYGCDACQEVCPLNTDKWKETISLSHLDELSEILTPLGLSEMDDRTYRQRIHPLFPYISIDNLERWHNNAKRALRVS